MELCGDCLNEYTEACSCIQPLALCEVVYDKVLSECYEHNITKKMVQVLTDHTYFKRKNVNH